MQTAEVSVKINVTADVMSEEEVLQAGIAELESKLNAARTKDTNREAAEGLFGVYRGFTDAGFSEEQAFELVSKMLANANLY